MGGLGTVALMAATPLGPAWSSTRQPIRIPTQASDSRFQLLWDGDRVGFHDVSIRPGATPGSAVIRTKVRLQMDMALITAYRLAHDSEEIWEDGRIARLESRSDDDGDVFKVVGRRTEQGFEITGPKGTTLAAPELPTSNAMWSQEMLSWPEVIDCQRGGVMGVDTRELGAAAVTVQGATRSARGYEFATPFARGDVWYDGNGRWVKMRLAIAGETIHYHLAA